MQCPACGLSLIKCGDVWYCSGCGIFYTVDKSPSPMDWGSFFTGLFVGAVFLGWLIYAPLGRELAVKSISAGAGVVESKVREWLAKGERRRK